SVRREPVYDALIARLGFDIAFPTAQSPAAIIIGQAISFHFRGAGEAQRDVDARTIGAWDRARERGAVQRAEDRGAAGVDEAIDGGAARNLEFLAIIHADREMAAGLPHHAKRRIVDRNARLDPAERGVGNR